MALEAWLLFVLTEGALCLTPGPAVLLVLSQGFTRGTAASIWSNLGILAANAAYFGVSATGVAVVLVASYDLFSLVRWVGAAYLIGLGVRAFFGRSSVLSVPAGAAPPASRWRIFVNGVVLQAANPKALLFFSAILPQFIDPQRSVVAQMAILGVTSVVLEFFVLLAYGTLAARAGVIALRPRFSTLANRVAGSLLVAAGVGLARARRA